jgi:hypothetical protein
MPALAAKEQHIQILSDISTSSATPAFGSAAANAFGKFGQPSSPFRLGFSEESFASDPKEWTRVEKRKGKKKRKEELKAVVSFYHFRSRWVIFNAGSAHSYSLRASHSTWRI